MCTLVLLNHCLRLNDNPLLQQAVGDVCAVVTLEKPQFFGKQYGLNRANLLRLRLQLQHILAFKQQLAQQQIGLVLLFGDSAAELLQLASTLNAQTILAAEPTAPEEYQLLITLAQQLDVKLNDCNSLLAGHLRPDITGLSDRFTTFRKSLEPLLEVTAATANFIQHAKQQWLTPAKADQLSQSWQPLTAFAWQAPLPLTQFDQLLVDEAATWRHLNHYIWQQKHILHYKDTRNALSGQHYASFFSAPLATGILSVRALWQQIVLFEQHIATNDSTYWLKFELLWREFFRWQMRKYQNRWFSATAIKGKTLFTQPKLNPKQQIRFTNWCDGNTGVPFVDANMRLLNQTGLMSNRGRQNVASYLIHDLGLDWRLGAAYFEQRLLDYDPASNWGNWAYIAGYGNSEPRPFNIIKQALSYDPNADFVREMLPAITTPGKQAHRPSAELSLPVHWQHWLSELG